ncbi:hypothetical protein [Cryptosporangium arvum]|uniref:hypothetical protein n=1 Tax=Cryptosporangium arvum TaxID=80871 RepID=UPI0004B53D5A|nr:hypothetical protein [Cryptosporangium arvum]
MDESTTRMLLERVLAQAPPPAPVDYDRVAALATARRSALLRSTIAAAAVLVLVVTVTVAVLTGGVEGDRAAPPALKPAETEQRAAADGLPDSAPAWFDPARSTLTIGGLPGSMPDRATANRTTDLEIRAAGRGTSLRARVGVRGYDLSELIGDGPAASTTGPAIEGHPSEWVDQGDERYTLVWRWAEDAWASVATTGLPDPLALATTVATSMSVDLEARTRLPFTVTTPDGFELTEVDTGSAPSVSMEFTGPSSTMRVTVEPLGDGIGAATETFRGRPARVDGTAIVMAAGAVKVTVACRAKYDPCRETAASVDPIADLADPAAWPPYSPR